MEKKRIVVKIGTSLLTLPNGRLDVRRMARFAKEIARIHRQGHEVLVVSSGAISAGVGELGWSSRPTELAQKQAAAAVGQVSLMERYHEYFRRDRIPVAQLLLTREDFNNPVRYQNARATVLALLKDRVIPVINENDTVSVDEIRVGDNDTLAALVAIKVQAHLLILLTDVDGLMSRPPRHGRGRLIAEVDAITPEIEALALQLPGSAGGTGGMHTKIQAARQATAEGVEMVIANGRKAGVMSRLIDGEPAGTRFRPARPIA